MFAIRPGETERNGHEPTIRISCGRGATANRTRARLPIPARPVGGNNAKQSSTFPERLIDTLRGM
jgi:hypothetical protein